MELSRRKGGWLDAAGAAVSWMCAVHCLLLPFVLSLAPFIGLGFLANESFEWAIIAVSILIAALSLLPAYFREHRKIRALLFFAVGFGFVMLSKLIFEDNLARQIPVIVFGAAFITAAHLVNRRLCRACSACANHKTKI
jgi:uncharacterized membrane protein